MLFNSVFTNSFLPYQQDFLKQDLEKMDMLQEDIVSDPYELGRPSLSEYEIKIIADKISSKLLKLVEEQLQGQPKPSK